VRGGMFMLRRLFQWPDTSEPRSGSDHGCEKRLTEWFGVRYAQESHKMGFFINMKKVLPSSGLVRGDSGVLSL